MMKARIYPSILFFLIFASCTSSKIDLKDPTNNGDLILSMERTPCFGICPVYEIKIFSNGLLLYNGKRNTERHGCYFKRISKKELRRLENSFQQADFFGLENKYPTDESAPSDLPSCIIYFKNNSGEKQIVDQHWQTPERLTYLEKRIDSLTLRGILHSCDN